jgi:hypothetical protein
LTGIGQIDHLEIRHGGGRTDLDGFHVCFPFVSFVGFVGLVSDVRDSHYARALQARFGSVARIARCLPRNEHPPAVRVAKEYRMRDLRVGTRA